MFNRLRQLDWTLIIVPSLLMFIGIVVIYTVTFATVGFNLARSQIVYMVIGLVAALILTYLDYRSWESLAYAFYGIGIALLVAVIFIGSKQFGAARWIDLGFFQLQPSEIFKLILILVMARLCSAWAGSFTIGRLITVLVVAMIPTVFIFKQPDLGTASVLFAITFGMLLFAKLPWKWWAVMIGLGLVLLPVGYLTLQPYQRNRIHVFLNPEADPKGKGYNVRQATIAIGSGGLTGQGLGKGTQSALNFLPVAHTDFIFAGLAEATGLLGSTIVLALYMVFAARIFRVAEIAKDNFGSFVALGYAVMIGFQVFINVGMNIGIMPVTGIPLPFISSGGTSLIISLAGLGILQSIYIRHKKITF